MGQKTMTASEMGKIGGKNRAAAMTPAQRQQVARKGGRARWKKYRKTILAKTA
jgi:general stress protein YciG